MKSGNINFLEPSGPVQACNGNALLPYKKSALNTRLLKALCDEMGSDHQNRLFRSEVRWLSRDEVLKRLYGLQKEVELFLIEKKSDLSHYFQDTKWVARLE